MESEPTSSMFLQSDISASIWSVSLLLEHDSNRLMRLDIDLAELFA